MNVLFAHGKKSALVLWICFPERRLSVHATSAATSVARRAARCGAWGVEEGARCCAARRFGLKVKRKRDRSLLASNKFQQEQFRENFRFLFLKLCKTRVFFVGVGPLLTSQFNSAD